MIALAAVVAPIGALRAEDSPATVPMPVMQPFDPLRGMEATGRIPKVPLPDDVPNPERWRYIPEGRIKPGSMVDRFMVTDFIYPTFDYEKNVGAGGGLAVTDIDFRNQRRREFAAIFASYTTEGQQRFSLLWQRWLHDRDLPQGGMIQEERSALSADVSYIKTLTMRFYGIGSRTQAGDETSYTDEATVASLSLADSLPRPGDNVVARLGLRGEYHNLASGRVDQRPSTEQVYPELMSSAGDALAQSWRRTDLTRARGESLVVETQRYLWSTTARDHLGRPPAVTDRLAGLAPIPGQLPR